jgi:hypothetical protein
MVVNLDDVYRHVLTLLVSMCLGVFALKLIPPDGCHRTRRHEQGRRTDEHDTAIPCLKKQFRVSCKRGGKRPFDRDKHEYTHADLEALEPRDGMVED